MAKTKQLEKSHYRSRGKYRSVERKKTGYPNNYVQRTEQKGSLPSSSRFNPAAFIRVKAREFDLVETSIITRENIWWNHCDQETLIKIYRIAMAYTGKTLKQLSIPNLVNFIEGSLIEIEEAMGSELDFMGENEVDCFIRFDTKYENVVLMASSRIYYLEDRTSFIEAKGKKPENYRMEQLMSVINSRVFDIAHVYSNQLDKVEIDPDEFVSALASYRGSDEDEEFRKDSLAIIEEYRKAVQSSGFKSRKKAYDELFEMPLDHLQKLIKVEMHNRGFNEQQIDEYMGLLEFEMSENLMSPNTFGNETCTLAYWFLGDNYQASYAIYNYYQCLLELEQESFCPADVRFETNLLEVEVPEEYQILKSFNHWLCEKPIPSKSLNR